MERENKWENGVKIREKVKCRSGVKSKEGKLTEKIKWKSKYEMGRWGEKVVSQI